MKAIWINISTGKIQGVEYLNILQNTLIRAEQTNSTSMVCMQSMWARYSKMLLAEQIVLLPNM